MQPLYDYYVVLLQNLLEEVDENSSVGMSFNVSGGLVYGHMVTGSVWEKLWLREVGQQHEWTASVLDQVLRADDRRRRERGEQDELSGFVHLKDAVFVSGTIRRELGLWRAPLAQIAGWSNKLPHE